MLEELGLEAAQAANGEEALAQLENAIQEHRPFTTALIDWVMPGMHGGAVVNAIRARFGVMAPKLLVVSAYDTGALRESVESLGITHFLPKPVLPSSLQQLFAEPSAEHNAASDGTSMRRIAITEPMRVLVVEDHPINQQLTLELLRDIGVLPELAENGEEALHMIDAHEPDYYSLVLMDVQMPVLDGYEATKRLRADSRYARLPIVAMTAHVTVEERERCLALGMQGHVGKPIDPDELCRLVTSYYYSSHSAPSEHEESPAQDMTIDVGDNEPHDELRELSRIDGLDVANALNRVRKPALYHDLLRQFMTEYRTFGDEIRRLLCDGRCAEAQRLSHSLKGVAAMLGAIRVSEAAGRLEDALSRDEKPGAAVQSVESELATVLSGLRACFQVHAHSSDPAILRAANAQEHPVGSSPDWLNELRCLLRDGDVAAQRLCDEHSDELRRVLPPDSYARLRKAVDNFEFDTALELVRMPHPEVQA
jgi:CheY-like chemotaxis protein